MNIQLKIFLLDNVYSRTIVKHIDHDIVASSQNVLEVE